MERAEEWGEDSTGHAPRQPAFHSGRYGISFYREPRAYLVRRDRNSFDDSPHCPEMNFLRDDRHNLFMLVGENFPEPTHTTGERQHRAKDTHGSARQQSREHQRKSKS